MIDDLARRWQTGIYAAEPGSVLSGDDRHSRPFQVSHAAWHCLVHAIDNLHALRILTVHGEAPNFRVSTHPFAQYPLLRAALENASAAVWMLSPASRNERLTRRFRLVYEDAKNRDLASALVGHTADLAKRRLERLAPTLDARGISRGKVKAGVKFGAIVEDAGAFVGDSEAPLFFWRLLSGMSHGEMWASHTATDRDEVYVAPDGDTITVMTTSSLSNIAALTKIALRTTQLGLHEYDRKRSVGPPIISAIPESRYLGRSLGLLGP